MKQGERERGGEAEGGRQKGKKQKIERGKGEKKDEVRKKKYHRGGKEIMLLRGARKRRKRGRKERGGREGRMRDRGKTKEGAIVCQYLVGWLKTVAMLDPVKLSELAKVSTDGWAPSPTTTSFGVLV